MAIKLSISVDNETRNLTRDCQTIETMKKRIITPKIQRFKYVVCDYVGYNLAFLLFNVCRYHFLPRVSATWTIQEYLTTPILSVEQVLIPLGLLFLAWLSGYYNKVVEKSRLQEFLSTMSTSIIGGLIIFLMMLINDHAGRRRYDYELIGILIGLLFTCSYIPRLIITSFAIYRFRNSQWLRNTIFVGNRHRARSIVRKINSIPNRSGINVMGYYPLSLNSSAHYHEPTENIDNHKVTNSESVADRSFHLHEIEELCQSGKVDQIIIAPNHSSDKMVMQALMNLYHTKVPIKIAPNDLSFITSSIKLEDVYAEPFIDLTSPALSEFSKNFKRLFDVCVASCTLLLISPLLAAVALAVKITSKGPVIYSQERIGYRHRPFKIYKFRSMYPDAERLGPQLSCKTDSRVTPVGRILRKYRLDELPQFWNVLKGDMSLVGPRPEREFFIRKIVKQLPYYTMLCQVRPGITSWGMVKYGYAKNVDEMVKRAKFDLIYISNMSLAMDLKILIYTIKTIITGQGV